MRLPFRQGVVKSNLDLIQVSGTRLDVVPADVPAKFALADNGSDYLHTENSLTVGAWNVPGTTDPVYLYLELNSRTAQRTFGYTDLPAEYGLTAPLYVNEETSAPMDPPHDQHWFDTSTMQMKVYDSTVRQWMPKLRVFIAEYISGSPVNYYDAGTQVGVTNHQNPRPTGSIVYDRSGKAIKNSTGEFFTTESDFHVSNAYGNSLRLEASQVQAQAAENMPAFSVVTYEDFDSIRLADYEDVYTSLIGILLQDGLVDAPVEVLFQGEVTNIAWDWTEQGVGNALWVDQNGELTVTDPWTVDGTRGDKKPPVARISGKDSVIFDQGLGGTGMPGRDARIIDSIPQATVEGYGTVRISMAHSPLSDGPVAVETSDPRMSNARPPLPHSHLASEIVCTAVDVNEDVDSALQYLTTSRIDKAGDTMDGYLNVLYPQYNTNAANKQYVDDRISGLYWLDPIALVNLISDSENTPPVSPNDGDAYVVAAGGTSSWSGLDDRLVIWSTEASAWLDRGLLDDLAVEDYRFGIAFTSVTTPTGSFDARKNQIAIYQRDTADWTFQTPTETNAVYVASPLSLNSQLQYVFDENSWTLFGGASALQPNKNLEQVGNLVDVVDYADGGTIDAMYLQSATLDDIINHPGSNSTVAGIADIIADTSIVDVLSQQHTGKAERLPYYLNEAALPSAVANEGMYAFVKATNSAYVAINGTWERLVSSGGQIEYDMSFYAGRLMSLNDPVGVFVATRDIQWLEDAPGSQVTCITPPDINLSINVEHNGVHIGQLTIDAGANVGTLTISAGTMSSGDTLVLRTTGVIDATVAHIACTMIGSATLINL